MAKLALGIEFGSTRIKAVAIDDNCQISSSGDYTWKSDFQDGVWTYPMTKVWEGLRQAVSGIRDTGDIGCAVISGMMHGYLPFDKNWKLLTPFRTWQNTMTGQAARELSERFGMNIPQRWSIAHLYQAVLNGEEHVSQIAHITTLAGYVHHALTGVNAVGVGEASGIFPIDAEQLAYDPAMLDSFRELTKKYNLPWDIRDLLPDILPAGADAGELTETGSALLGGTLPTGLPFAPPEGDAGTGMTATNAVAPRTGNVSAGTSIFSMVVLEKPLSKPYPEIDMVTTPTGKPVAMVHCNNCTNDSNAWVMLMWEVLELFGQKPNVSELYTRLYKKSLEGVPDCDGVYVCNYMSGEHVTGFSEGRPLVVRQPESKFNLANFFRATLYSTMASLKIGMDILRGEHVVIDSLTGHGGLFKTPLVGQRYLAAACGAPVTCMETAGEGGPYGAALLAAYAMRKAEGETLEQFLNNRVFGQVSRTTLAPDEKDAEGFDRWIKGYRALLEVERAAVENMK